MYSILFSTFPLASERSWFTSAGPISLNTLVSSPARSSSSFTWKQINVIEGGTKLNTLYYMCGTCLKAEHTYNAWDSGKSCNMKSPVCSRLAGCQASVCQPGPCCSPSALSGGWWHCPGTAFGASPQHSSWHDLERLWNDIKLSRSQIVYHFPTKLYSVCINRRV